MFNLYRYIAVVEQQGPVYLLYLGEWNRLAEVIISVVLFHKLWANSELLRLSLVRFRLHTNAG